MTPGGLVEDDGPARGLAVYVHFPWCLAKCPYCDFLSVAAERKTLPHDEYARAVTEELSRRVAWIGRRQITSVFFGGGTPSLWEPRALGRVLTAIKHAFDVAPELEVTVECNPTSFDADRARALRAEGVNRVSLGVQGLDAKRLAFLGRLHDPASGLRALEAAVESDIERVSADMIFGVAGQTPQSAADEVRTIADVGPTHLSAYALTIEPGTQFGQLARRGRLPQATDDAVADSFLAVESALAERGFEHYEVSNYARHEHVARHNLTYWRGDEYLGLGVGAWGTVVVNGARLRYRNGVVPETYMREGAWTAADLLSAASDGLVRELEPIDAETALTERILLGLRLTEGVDLEAAARALGVDAFPEARARVKARLLERGDLEAHGSRLAIPRDRWLRADDIIARLL